MAKVRTVLGDVDPSSLGVTYGHEHVSFNPLLDRGSDFIRIEHSRSFEELSRFRLAGGSALVDATVAELGRDPTGLRDLSKASGIHVVAACGHSSQEWWDGALDLQLRSDLELVEEFVSDLTDGIGDTGVRAGIIKIGTSMDEVTNTEGRIIKAAAAAQRATGAPITTHTTAGTMGLEQIRRLYLAGADLSKVCIGHLDRRLVIEEHLEIAGTGVYLGYDQVSKEKYASDANRAQFLSRLVDAGFGDRVILGSDLARRSDLAAWGGSPGLTHLATSFVDLLGQHGLDPEVERFLIENPRRFLAWA
ncbi:MAG: phosphotriesterase family protein [Acidimicrobiia bacterium]